MALQNSIDNLKQKPKDERTAVASGIALSVVIVLLIAWVIGFFHKIQNGAIKPTFESGAQSAFNPAGVNEAQQAINEEYTTSAADIQDLRDQIQGPMQAAQTPSNPFGSSASPESQSQQ